MVATENAMTCFCNRMLQRDAILTERNTWAISFLFHHGGGWKKQKQHVPFIQIIIPPITSTVALCSPWAHPRLGQDVLITAPLKCHVRQLHLYKDVYIQQLLSQLPSVSALQHILSVFPPHNSLLISLQTNDTGHRRNRSTLNCFSFMSNALISI